MAIQNISTNVCRFNALLEWHHEEKAYIEEYIFWILLGIIDCNSHVRNIRIQSELYFKNIYRDKFIFTYVINKGRNWISGHDQLKHSTLIDFYNHAQENNWPLRTCLSQEQIVPLCVFVFNSELVNWHQLGWRVKGQELGV